MNRTDSHFGDVKDSAFRELMVRVEQPLAIVTTAVDGEWAGCLIGFWTQASIDPARVIVMLSKANRTYRLARSGKLLVVHYLHKGNQRLAELFGAETGDVVDKFRFCDWEEGPGGVPILAGVLGWLAGTVVDRLDAGDHAAYLLGADRVGFDDARADRTAPALLTQRDVADLEPGHPA